MEISVLLDQDYDDECEALFSSKVLPTLRTMIAVLRNARNDLNTRAYHRGACIYYRGVVFEYHCQLLQACFDASGLDGSCIDANNARSAIEKELGFVPGYLAPSYSSSRYASPEIAAQAALDLYMDAERNRKIAEQLLSGTSTDISRDEIAKLELKFHAIRLNLNDHAAAEQSAEFLFAECEHINHEAEEPAQIDDDYEVTTQRIVQPNWSSEENLFWIQKAEQLQFEWQ